MKDHLGTYRDSVDVRNEILRLAQKKGQVVYGQQSVNAQVPTQYKRKTKDYDIYTKKPKDAATELAGSLNKVFGGGFTVKKARNEKTWKVKQNGETVADYTSTTKKPKSKKVLGVKYANIPYQKKKLKKIMKSKGYEFRRKKDTESLSKINKYEMTDFIMN